MFHELCEADWLGRCICMCVCVVPIYKDKDDKYDCTSTMVKSLRSIAGKMHGNGDLEN